MCVAANLFCRFRIYDYVLQEICLESKYSISIPGTMPCCPRRFPGWGMDLRGASPWIGPPCLDKNRGLRLSCRDESGMPSLNLKSIYGRLPPVWISSSA